MLTGSIVPNEKEDHQLPQYKWLLPTWRQPARWKLLSKPKESRTSSSADYHFWRNILNTQISTCAVCINCYKWIAPANYPPGSVSTHWQLNLLLAFHLNYYFVLLHRSMWLSTYLWSLQEFSVASSSLTCFKLLIIFSMPTSMWVHFLALPE